MIIVLAPQIHRTDYGSMPQFLNSVVSTLETKCANIKIIDRPYVNSSFLPNFIPIIIQYYILIFLICLRDTYKRENQYIALSQEYIIPFNLSRQICIHYDLIQAFYPKNLFKKILYRQVIPLCYPKMRAVFYLSETSKRIANLIIKKEINWHGPTYVPLQFKRHIHQFRKSEDREYFALWVGALSTHKNVDLFIQVINKMNKPAAIVVPKTQVDYLKRKLDNVSCYNISVYSGLSVDALMMLMKNSKYIVNTSYTEGFGMPIMEAQHCGCIPIIPNTAINRELFPDAHLFSVKSEKSLRYLLNEICKRPQNWTEIDALRFESNFSEFLKNLDLLSIQKIQKK